MDDFAGMTDVEKNMDDIGTASFDIHCIYNQTNFYYIDRFLIQNLFNNAHNIMVICTF